MNSYRRNYFGFFNSQMWILAMQSDMFLFSKSQSMYLFHSDNSFCEWKYQIRISQLKLQYLISRWKVRIWFLFYVQHFKWYCTKEVAWMGRVSLRSVTTIITLNYVWGLGFLRRGFLYQPLRGYRDRQSCNHH